jgi:hypothetical protein
MAQIAFSIKLHATKHLLTTMKASIPTLALLILNLVDGAPTKEKYVYSGNNVWATMNWAEGGCDYSNYMDFDAGTLSPRS